MQERKYTDRAGRVLAVERQICGGYAACWQAGRRGGWPQSQMVRETWGESWEIAQRLLDRYALEHCLAETEIHCLIVPPRLLPYESPATMRDAALWRSILATCPERIFLEPGVVLLCYDQTDERAPVNRLVPGVGLIRGMFVVAGLGADDGLASLTEAQLAAWRALLAEAAPEAGA